MTIFNIYLYPIQLHFANRLSRYRIRHVVHRTSRATNLNNSQSHNPYNPQNGHVGQPQSYEPYGHQSPELFNRQSNSLPYDQQQYGANVSYYNPESHNSGLKPSEEERRLGSTVTGGAAGGFVAHQMGGGKLATAGGALLEAVGMNMATHKYKKHQQQQEQQFQQQQPAQNVVVVPAQTIVSDPGLGGGLLGGGRLGGGIELIRVGRRIAARRGGL
ncbi:unnamed protein product [Penicillium bialowiezense]